MSRGNKPLVKDGTKYTLVVTCVVMRDNASRPGSPEVLILKRSQKESEGPGLWTIPGGKIDESDWGKSVATHRKKGVWQNVLKHGILREIVEESGILQAGFIREPKILPERDKVFIRRDGTPTLVVVFWALVGRAVSGVKAGEDTTDYRWVPEKDIHRFRFIGNVVDDIRVALKEAHHIFG